MKKFFVFIICMVFICATPILVYAQTDGIDTDMVTIEEEAPSANQISEPTETITTEKIVSYIKGHFEEISVILTLILTAFYNVRKHHVLNKSVSTLNNNAVTVVKDSESAIGAALAQVETAAVSVASFKEEFAAFLSEIQKEHAEKERLEKMLADVDSHLKTAKLANVELGNEVAELLVLANIPNSKKEELYSRHRAAVDAIESVPTNITEVNEDDGKETQGTVLDI